MPTRPSVPLLETAPQLLSGSPTMAGKKKKPRVFQKHMEDPMPTKGDRVHHAIVCTGHNWVCSCC